MLLDSHMRTQIAGSRIHDQIAAAERARLVRGGRMPRARRIATLRLLARGLRVERDIRFEPDLPLEVARLHGGR